MMKKTLFIAFTALCVLVVFAFGACNFNFILDGEFTFEAEGKEDCLEFFDDFFEDFLKEENFEVTVTSKTVIGDRTDRSSYVESIDGKKDKLARENDTVYTFEDDGVYYTLTQADTGSYYQTGKSAYDDMHFYFMKSTVDFLKSIEEDAEFTCLSKVESNEKTVDGKEVNESTAALTLEVNFSGSEDYVKITANNIDGITQNINIEIKTALDGGEVKLVTTTMNITTGSAVVTIPDYTGWEMVE